MFTETELREALEHSAARADTVAAAPRAPHRPLLLPLAAAAAVAALAVGGAVVAGAGGGSPRHSAAASPSVPSPVTSAAPVDAHVPVDLADVVDRIQVAHDYHSYLTIGGNGDAQVGSETFEKFLGGNRTLDVTVVDSPAFDATRVPRDKPVAIAGTTGWFARFKLFPLDANTGPGSDKYTSPWTIAFRAPSGNWVFVSIENGVDFAGVDDPDAIVTAYDSLGVRFVADASRLPFRTGYLPAGYSFDNSVLGYGESMTVLSKGDRTIEIDVLHDRAAGECVSQCGATRRIGRYTINVWVDEPRGSVTGSTVSLPVSGSATMSVPPSDPGAAALERRILDGLQLAPDLADPSTYWTIADALG